MSKENVKKQNVVWHLVLHDICNGIITLNTDDVPMWSGSYLCTCVEMRNDKVARRYLQIMEYDDENECWHDCGNPGHVSHKILAWTDSIELCDVAVNEGNIEYVYGCFFKKNQ